MKGQNEAWHYTIRADGIVTKSPTGPFLEEYRWSAMESDGKPVTLSAESLAYSRKGLARRRLYCPECPHSNNVDRALSAPSPTS